MLINSRVIVVTSLEELFFKNMHHKLINTFLQQNPENISL